MSNENSPTNSDDEQRSRRFGQVLHMLEEYVLLRQSRIRRQLRNDAETCSEKVQRLLCGHPQTIFNKIRMNANTFRTLSHILNERRLVSGTINSTTDEKLIITLEFLAQSTTNREAQEHWNRSAESISRWFKEVVEALCRLKDEYIKLPDQNRVQDSIVENQHKYRPWFDVSFIVSFNCLPNFIIRL